MLRKLKDRIGINPFKPVHWFRLSKLVFFYLFQNVLSKYSALPFITRNRIRPQTHAQIWNRIKPAECEFDKMKRAVGNLKRHHTFSIFIASDDLTAVSSIRNQIYDRFEIISGGINAFSKATGDYVLFLQPGDFLHKNALFELVYELNRINKQPPLLYFDHDYFTENTTDKPYYKPGWSPDLLLVNNYINRACAFRRDLLEKIEIEDYPFYAAVYDIALKISDYEPGHHKPGILLTMPDSDDERSFDPIENIIREKTVKRRGIDGIIKKNKYGAASLQRNLLGNPKISIIIPTIYKESFLENCLNSICNLTTYDNYEIVIIDNSGKPSEYGKEILKKYECKIIYINEPFNWSRLNNLGAKEADGEILIFLNDDTEILTSNWLERMAAEAQRPEIGAVGVLQLFPDNRVQSAGVFMHTQLTVVAHSFSFSGEDSTVYHNFLHYTRPCSSFQGACFAIEKNKLNDVNGFNESFPVICNEEALTFKLRKHGYYNLYLAEVQIIHYERVSRGKYNRSIEMVHINQLWNIWYTELLENDIFFNPYLDSSKTDYSEDYSPVISRLPDSPPNNKLIHTSLKTQKKNDKLINSIPFFNDGVFFGIHICNNSDTAWPVEKYAQLCDLISLRLNGKIVLCGGKKETGEIEKLISLLKNRENVISMAGIFSLHEFSCFVKKIDFFLGTGSRGTHIAGIQGVSTLVIRHGILDAQKHKTMGKAVMQIECNTICKSCYIIKCDDKICFSKIQANHVYDALERLMILFPSKRQINSN